MNKSPFDLYKAVYQYLESAFQTSLALMLQCVDGDLNVEDDVYYDLKEISLLLYDKLHYMRSHHKYDGATSVFD